MKTLLQHFAIVVATLGLAGWIASFVYFAHLQSTCPSSPVPSVDQTIEEKNHGKRFYVTPTQKEILLYGRVGSWIVLAIGIGIGFCLRPAREEPNSSTAQRP